jgi:hypothetical protein
MLKKNTRGAAYIHFVSKFMFEDIVAIWSLFECLLASSSTHRKLKMLRCKVAALIQDKASNAELEILYTFVVSVKVDFF